MIDNNTNKAFQKSLDIQDDRINPFIPFLLQDLWFLGCNYSVVPELIKHIKPDEEFRIIDLGCGKGATIIELAGMFPGTYTGVDIMAEFIEEGIKKAKELGLSHKVTLIAEDLKKTLNKSVKYDIIIYGYDLDLLGSTEESLKAINKIKKADGYIILETTFKSNDYEGKEYLNKDDLFYEIKKTGLKILDFIIWDREILKKENRKNNFHIKNRVEELKKEYSEYKNIFDNFYTNQLKECEILDNFIDCITFLLK